MIVVVGLSISGCSSRSGNFETGHAKEIEISLGSDPDILVLKLSKTHEKGYIIIEPIDLLPPDFEKTAPIKTASFANGIAKFEFFNRKLKVLEKRSLLDAKKMLDELDIYMGLPCKNWFTHAGVIGVTWSYENKPDRYAQLDLGCHLAEIDEIRTAVYKQFDEVERSIPGSQWVETEAAPIDK